MYESKIVVINLLQYYGAVVLILEDEYCHVFILLSVYSYLKCSLFISVAEQASVRVDLQPDR